MISLIVFSLFQISGNAPIWQVSCNFAVIKHWPHGAHLMHQFDVETRAVYQLLRSIVVHKPPVADARMEVVNHARSCKDSDRSISEGARQRQEPLRRQRLRPLRTGHTERCAGRIRPGRAARHGRLDRSASERRIRIQGPTSGRPP